ncbi:hypothetical protein AMJ57_04310 [Parcubacteria bacterium SG8_24]|nr:MAG: hypothetical protein AMJ57_04310 [Parcubacteria bacterium SG8_24]
MGWRGKKGKRIPFNRAIRVLLATNSLILLSGAMLGPIYALFVERVGGDLLDASFAGGVFALAAGLTTLVAGRYADRVRENELIIVFGYVLIGLGFFLYTAVQTVWHLLLVQALIGFAEAVYSPAFDAVYSKHLDRHKAGREWGAWESINYFSTAVGAVIGGFIVVTLGFNSLFLVMGTLSLFSAFYVYALPRNVL